MQVGRTTGGQARKQARRDASKGARARAQQHAGTPGSKGTRIQARRHASTFARMCGCQDEASIAHAYIQ
eukprot:9848840-Alexandrium_andersonii.AAC.1